MKPRFVVRLRAGEPDAGVDEMRAAIQAGEHAPGFVHVARLAEHGAVEFDEGIDADDDRTRESGARSGWPWRGHCGGRSRRGKGGAARFRRRRRGKPQTRSRAPRGDRGGAERRKPGSPEAKRHVFSWSSGCCVGSASLADAPGCAGAPFQCAEAAGVCQQARERQRCLRAHAHVDGRMTWEHAKHGRHASHHAACFPLGDPRAASWRLTARARAPRR